jgi:hypothetical protein
MILDSQNTVKVILEKNGISEEMRVYFCVDIQLVSVHFKIWLN